MELLLPFGAVAGEVQWPVFRLCESETVRTEIALLQSF